jgi:TIR domain/NB-ARC domain
MPDPSSARIFISYSRKDGAKFAAKLRKRLEREELSVWQDLIALEGGRDWWSQIEDALKLKALQHFVLVVTPAALASPIVRREIRLARQEGKTVCPVKGPGLGELGNLPRWLGQIYDLDLAEHRTTLTRVLQDQSRQKRVAMMAQEPPADFVARPVEFAALKKQLLDSKGDAVAITAALRGAGGYGKTTLAKALAHDADIQDAYFDGILWATLGEKPESLLLIISDLITRLTGSQPGLNTINAAASALGEALGDRRILLVGWTTSGANRTSRASCRGAPAPPDLSQRATTVLCPPMRYAKAWTPCATARRLS